VSIIIQVTVQQGLSNALQNYVEKYPATVANALKTVAERVLETSNVLVPVRTGFLKSTLGYRLDSCLQVTFFATASYASYVEFGTSRMPARLFLTRSIQQHEAEFPQEVLSALAQLCGNLFTF
jgi:HK97 gp10 family phage protein